MKKQTLTIMIMAAVLMTGVIWYSYGSGSGFLGMLKKPVEAGEIPSWCTQECPIGTYSEYGKYNPDGTPVCTNGQGGSTTPGSEGSGTQGTIYGTQPGKTPGSKTNPTSTPKQLTGKKDPRGGTPIANSNSKYQIPSGLASNLKPSTTLKNLNRPILVNQPTPGTVPVAPTVTFPSKGLAIYTCSCTSKSVSNFLGTKSFDCPKNFGEFKTYKDLDGTKVYVFKEAEANCHFDKWQCPNGYTRDNYKLDGCDTRKLEIKQKLAECNGTTPPPDLDADTKEICLGFNPQGVLLQPDYEKFFKDAECVSEETCKKYANSGDSSDLMAVYDAANPIYGSLSTLTGLQKTIASCYSLYPELAWSIGGGGGN
ncbi:MAG: hypothetical protein AAB373_02605 [Patescibacteria group bacterium]